VSTNREARAKSWLLLIAGLAGIGYQQWTGEVNWILLLVFTTMTGIPGIAEIISLIRSSPLVLQSSSSPSEPLEQASGTLSQNSSADEQ